MTTRLEILEDVYVYVCELANLPPSAPCDESYSYHQCEWDRKREVEGCRFCDLKEFLRVAKRRLRLFD